MATVIGTGVVNIQASTKDFEATLAKLPDATKRYFEASERNVRTAMEQIRRDMQAAMSVGNMPAAHQFLKELQQSEKALASVHNEARAMAGTMGGSLASGGSRGAQALYQLGSALDDLQYGFRGVLNNLPMIALAMGKPGLAGGIAIAATATYQLFQHYDELLKAFGLNKVKSEAEQMKQLAENTARTATEQERLNRARQQQGTVEAQQGQLSKEEEESARRIHEAIGEAGGSARIKEALGKSGLAKPDEAERLRLEHEIENLEDYRKLAKAVGGLGGAAAEFTIDQQLKKKRDELQSLQRRAEETYLADVENSRGGRREQLAEFAAKHPEMFGAGKTLEERRKRGNQFAAELVTGGPENARAREEEKGFIAEQERKHKGRNKEKEAADRDVNRMEKEGARSVKQFEDERKRMAHEAARSMLEGSIGRKQLEVPEANLENDVRARMKAQGRSAQEIEMLAKATADAIREAIQKKLEENVGKFGGTVGDARKRLVEEADQKEADAAERVRSAQERYGDAQERIRDVLTGGKGGRQQSAFVGLTDFAKQMQTAMLNQRPEDKQKELIRALDDGTKAEKDLVLAIRNQQRVVALAAGGPGGT
jgi:hypothetical protein